MGTRSALGSWGSRFVIGGLGVMGLGGAAYASAPAGVWGKAPLEVTVFGGESATPTVVIRGLFTVHDGEGPGGTQWGMSGFSGAVEGYLYYACPTGQAELCLLAWSDIQKATSDTRCVGWGDAEGTSNGTVRPEGTPLSNPDPFPFGVGVVSGYSPCASYLDLYVPPTEDVTVEPGPEAVEPAPEVVEATPDASDPVPLPDTTGGDTATGDTASADTADGAVGKKSEGCASGLGSWAALGVAALVGLARGRRGSRS